MTQSESDIVDWLRSRAIVGDDRDPHWRAADEIERLRAERPGWDEAIEAAAKVADDMAENRRRIESRQGAYAASFIADRIRALHPSVAEGRRDKKI